MVEAPPFTIRTARVSDARAVNAYMRAIYAEEGNHLITRAGEFHIGPWRQRFWLARKLASPLETVLLATDTGGAVIGMLDSWTDRRARVRHSTTFGMSVARGWRCRGVGAALLSRFTVYVGAHTTLRRIELHVHSDNTHAITLYRGQGFALEGTRKRAVIYEDDRTVDDHLMALWPDRSPPI